MAHIEVSAQRTVAASPQVVYELIADYHNGHPHILPKQYFPSLVVEAGGRGTGTRIRFQMKTLGQTRTARAVIAEPEPGRVLTETDLDMGTGLVTTFTVDPVDGGQKAAVTIHTAWDKPGLAGWFEQRLAPGVLRKVFETQLAQLEDVARQREAAGETTQ